MASRMSRKNPNVFQRILTKGMRMAFSGYGGQSTGYFGQSFGWMWPFLPSSRYDYARECGDLWLNSAVGPTIGWIQRNFVEAELQVVDEDDDGNQKKRHGHPMITMIESPNPYYSGIDLWYATVLSYCVNGNAYWLKARDNDGAGRTVQLWWCPHWMLYPQWPDDGSKFISHYLYRINGVDTPVAVEDVVHFRFGLDPLNSRMGLSPLAAVLREVCTDNEISNYSASIMRNMGVPGMVVSPKESGAIIPFGEEQNIRARFEAAFTGDDRGLPLINTVPLDITVPGFNPDQLAIEVMRKVPEERITAALGIPASVVGLGAGLDRSTFNNLKESRQAAYENGIIPMQKAVAVTLNRQLLIDFEDGDPGTTVPIENQPDPTPTDAKTVWNYRKVTVLQEDLNKKSERYGQLFKDGLIKRSEGRSELGYAITPDDEVYSSDVETANQVEIAKSTPRPVAAGGGGK